MGENERDKNRKTGLWAVVAAVAVLAVGVVGYVMLHANRPSDQPASMSAASAVESIADQLFDVAVTGAPLATVYFATASAEMTLEATSTVDTALAALNADAGKKVLLSGYHDASGDPALNVELAKQRAKAVRAALVARGVAPERVLLRKPEVTDGGADANAARRVEVRLIDTP